MTYHTQPHHSTHLIPLTGEVQELELKVDLDSLDTLLDFLSRSFSGGTDVDAPLKLSLERLGQREWAQVMVCSFLLNVYQFERVGGGWGRVERFEWVHVTAGLRWFQRLNRAGVTVSL